MKKEQLIQMIREAINKVLNESVPAAPAKPGEKPSPTIAPGKPKPTKKPIWVPTPTPIPSPKQKKMNENEQQLMNKLIQKYKAIKNK